MYAKIIGTPQYNRPHCTKEMLASLSRAKGIEDYKIVAFVEPKNSEVQDLLHSVKFCPIEVVINDRILGTNLNFRRLYEYVLAQTDYGVFIEDDAIVSMDSLVFLEKMYEENKDEKIASVTLVNRYQHLNRILTYSQSELYSHQISETYVSYATALYREPFLSCLDVLCDDDCLACNEKPGLHYRNYHPTDFSQLGISEKLMKKIIKGETHLSIDIRMNDWFKYAGYKHIMSGIGRCSNIGKVGANVNEQFFNEHIACDIWIDKMRMTE
jgi:hypothetical protein